MQKIQINECDGVITISIGNIEVTIKSTKSVAPISTIMATSTVATTTPADTLSNNSPTLSTDDDYTLNMSGNESNTIYCYVYDTGVEYYDPLCMSCNGAEDMNCICPEDDSDVTSKFIYFNGRKNDEKTLRMTTRELKAYHTKRNQSRKRKAEEVPEYKAPNKYDDLTDYQPCEHDWTYDYEADFSGTTYICKKCNYGSNVYPESWEKLN